MLIITDNEQFTTFNSILVHIKKSLNFIKVVSCDIAIILATIVFSIWSSQSPPNYNVGCKFCFKTNLMKPDIANEASGGF